MSVQRMQIGHETRFILSSRSGPRWVLEYGEIELVPAVWKILRVEPEGREDLLATERFLTPDEQTVRQWLTPITGPTEAAELATAARAEPPKTSNWRRAGGG
jgi:hypothetical protein